MNNTTLNKFRLNNNVAIITGGAGLLGVQHAEAIAEAGGIPLLWDINGESVTARAHEIAEKFNVKCQGMMVDVTDAKSVREALDDIKIIHRDVNILINNAANDPKIDYHISATWNRLENYSLEMWQRDIDIGLTGAFLSSRIVGTYMANHGGGAILNIASDLGVIAPDQRIYRQPDLPENKQPVKPVTYSVIKHGIIGLTKYLATYWADKDVRVNSLSPGGIYTNQSAEFVKKLTNLIPMGRMANKDEYKAAVLFLISDASSYMTGANLILDGGRTCW
jgi:NAD(P)-dependent dehydrogenase (short-subunit alcohol dehydrogenase family)